MRTSNMRFCPTVRSVVISSSRYAATCFLAIAGLLLPTTSTAAVTADVRGATIDGFVRDADTNSGIAGARVHLQAQPAPFTLSAADGSFSLPVAPGSWVVTASVPYVRGAASNYTTGGMPAASGDTGVVIELLNVPAVDDPNYEVSSTALCGVCHSPIEDDWSTSSHARAATNSWVLDLFSGTGTAGGGAGYVYRDTHDPGETGFCATCHAPMADVFDPGQVMLDEVSGAALDGVSCVACHQIDSVDGDPNALHHLGSSTYRFADDPGGFPTTFWVFGPLDDVSYTGMAAVGVPFFEQPRLCASCHQYNNPDTGAPGQSTYEEWLASPWAVPGPNRRTCQDCHEPAAAAPDIACTVAPVVRPGEQIRSHRFEGSTPPQLESALRLDATTRVTGPVVTVDVEVENIGAGHSFPTGVSIRNGLLVVEAMFRGQALPLVSGPVLPFWASDDVPGTQPGDYAEKPGKGYARVLEGRINGAGPTVRPVLFIDAEAVFSDTRLASGSTDESTFVFALPADAAVGEPIEVITRLLYRRAYRTLAVTKGWEMTPAGQPVELEIARTEELAVVSANPLEIPVADPSGLVLLALLLVCVAWRILRRA